MHFLIHRIIHAKVIDVFAKMYNFYLAVRFDGNFLSIDFTNFILSASTQTFWLLHFLILNTFDQNLRVCVSCFTINGMEFEIKEMKGNFVLKTNVYCHLTALSPSLLHFYFKQTVPFSFQWLFISASLIGSIDKHQGQICYSILKVKSISFKFLQLHPSHLAAICVSARFVYNC